ncbi:phosphohydrolase [Micromonospora sp. HUAS YX12]|uniref:Phosphohydrolase n=1 Tax=Micromonospora sp. HUAS YX12 TaxID=3156396 RepID=A0AAU7QVZ2_9ACTN
MPVTIDDRTAVPSDARIRALHERLAPSREALRLVWTHCRIVCDIAEQLLDRSGVDADARFCSRHTGVGISRADVRRQGLPIPAADYTAVTAEEHLVMYADKFHSKTTPPSFVSAASYAVAVGRFGADKVDRFAALVERFGEPDLPMLAARYRQPIV